MPEVRSSIDCGGPAGRCGCWPPPWRASSAGAESSRVPTISRTDFFMTTPGCLAQPRGWEVFILSAFTPQFSSAPRRDKFLLFHAVFGLVLLVGFVFFRHALRLAFVRLSLLPGRRDCLALLLELSGRVVRRQPAGLRVHPRIDLVLF